MPTAAEALWQHRSTLLDIRVAFSVPTNLCDI